MKTSLTCVLAALLLPAIVFAPPGEAAGTAPCVNSGCAQDVTVAIPTCVVDVCVPDGRLCFDPMALLPSTTTSGTSARAGCCNQTHVSQPGTTTQWTYPSGYGATGYNRPSVAVSNPGSWAVIPGASFIWKENPQQPTSAFGFSVEFTREYVSCSTSPVQVVMKVNADDTFQVLHNNAVAGTCAATCWTSVHTVTVTALPYPQVNTFRWHVHNSGGGPAMLQYSYSF